MAPIRSGIGPHLMGAGARQQLSWEGCPQGHWQAQKKPAASLDGDPPPSSNNHPHHVSRRDCGASRDRRVCGTPNWYPSSTPEWLQHYRACHTLPSTLLCSNALVFGANTRRYHTKRCAHIILFDIILG